MSDSLRALLLKEGFHSVEQVVSMTDKEVINALGFTKRPRDEKEEQKTPPPKLRRGSPELRPANSFTHDPAKTTLIIVNDDSTGEARYAHVPNRDISDGERRVLRMLHQSGDCGVPDCNEDLADVLHWLGLRKLSLIGDEPLPHYRKWAAKCPHVKKHPGWLEGVDGLMVINMY